MLKRSKRKGRLDKSSILLFFIIAIILVTLVFGYFRLRTDIFTETVKKGEQVVILFAIGGDREYRFFELFMYNPQTNKGSITFIPGNVGSIIESLRRVDRIDVLYRPGDLLALKEKIEEITGVSIPFLIDLKEENVKELVDLLGGLELFIPNPVDLESREKKILLPSGSIVLDGDKIADFISYQDSLEFEIDRIGRKQKFLQSLLKKIGESSDFLLNRNSVKYLRKIMVTNLNSRALNSFVLEMAKLDSERIIFQRVLGSKRIVDDQELIFPHFDGELLKETLKQTQETIASSEISSDEELNIAIEILNGTNVNGLARRAANVFQSFGHDIVSVGNADNDQYLQTVVLDRKGKLESAQKVADLINCERVYSRIDKEVDLSIDVTLILGKDFDGRYCKK